ncbi:MAG: hypothetical protein SGJ18_13310 [Pseudomonadota bacterium]|nr:hypothetical protein [Pseudomonadota bacterium]
MNIINFLRLTIVTVLSALCFSGAYAGDLGGGGTLGGGTTLNGGSLGGGGMDIVLSETERKKLAGTGTAANAFSLWLNQMSEQQKLETLKNVFEIQILPQLISQ